MSTRSKEYKLEETRVKSLEDMSAEAVREHVREKTLNFKNSWRELAEALQVVWQHKLYQKWGYETFDQYTAQEVRVRKNTAMKLIRSYMFLKEQEPVYLEQAKEQDGQEARAVPSFEMVETLQKAKKTLDERGYEKVKNDLVNEGRDVREVKKDLTALIMKSRKDVDPEKEQAKRSKTAIKRVVMTLQEFAREIEMTHILPGKIADEIQKLISKIEACAPEDDSGH